MGGFGERLRREREMRGIALDEISTATKITNRFLRALEEEKFDLLPGGIFNKGFVRAYAKFLGIDEEQAVADYNSAAGVPLESEQEGDLSETLERWKRPEPEELKQKRTEERSSWSAIAVVVVLGSLVFAGWTYYAKRKAEREARESEAAAAQAASVRPPAPIEPEAEKPAAPTAALAEKPQATEPSSAGPPSSKPPSQTAVSAAAKPTTLPGSTGKPSIADTGAKPPMPTTSAASPSETGKATTMSKPGVVTANSAASVIAATRPGETTSKDATAAKVESAKTEAPASQAPIRLVLRAKQDSWVSVTADGRLVMKDSLPAGTEKSVRATGEVVLVLGNAAGIEVFYNGRALPALGDQGQVKTVTFTPEGYQ